MIIFGTTGITSVERKGSFHCPACGAGATYQKKGVRRFFTLFFVPLIPLHKAADFVQCDRCGGTFKPEVLTWGGVVPQGPVGGPPPLPGAAVAISPPPIPGGAAHEATVSFQANGVAKASMILGVVGLLTSFLFCPSIFLVIAGLVLGFIGLARAKKGGGVVGGRGQALAGITCSALGLVATISLTAAAMSDSEEREADRTPWDKAAARLAASSNEDAFGNTPEAVDLARKYAAMMNGLHEISFESKKGSKRSPRYVVYCELHDGTCAFLARVPDYRKFTDDAKEGLAEMAWSVAGMVTADQESMKEGVKLCVALRGVVMFGSIMTGESGDEAPPRTSKDDKDLAPFFPDEGKVSVKAGY